MRGVSLVLASPFPLIDLRSALALLLLFLLVLLGLFLCLTVNLDGALCSCERGWHEVVVVVAGLRHGFAAREHEQVRDAFAGSGARLEVAVSSVVLAPGFGGVTRHDAILIGLVAHDHEGELIGVLWRGLVKEVPFPEVESVKALLVTEVICEDAAIGATIESEANRGVLLLASRVPHL